VDPEHADRDAARRVAVLRAWLAGLVALVLTFLAVRWLMRRIWPDQHDLSDVGTDLLRVGISVAIAGAVAVAVGLVSYGRRREGA
jgi:hypothetical protein